MIGNQDPTHEEEPELKVTDRRKFNPDGSVREGVTLEPEPKAPEAVPVAENIISPTESAAAPAEAPVATETAPEDELEFDDENPASFINFLSTLVTNAAASLGAIPHPVTGQKTVDLDTGRYWIDVLQMLREKTANNLSSQENRLLESVLSDLQLQYVTLARATEQKLKTQAAQKFSSKDILGG
jgi:hypothetical protein